MEQSDGRCTTHCGNWGNPQNPCGRCNHCFKNGTWLPSNTKTPDPSANIPDVPFHANQLTDDFKLVGIPLCEGGASNINVTIKLKNRRTVILSYGCWGSSPEGHYIMADNKSFDWLLLPEKWRKAFISWIFENYNMDSVKWFAGWERPNYWP